MEERLALAEKVVYNFPNAGSVEASQSLIQGSVLAPKATFTGTGHGGNGHIYGHIVARNFVAQGNFTIHAFELSHWVYDIVEDAVSGQVETGEINLRHYLYFQGEPTSIRAWGGEFFLERDDGTYYDGSGGFAQSVEGAAVYSTAADAYTLIRDVPLGEYTLINSRAPEGFTVNYSNVANPFTLFAYPLSIRRAGETVSAVRYSEPDVVDIHCRKTDGETGRGLPGAVFVLLREADEYQDGAVANTFVSGEEGEFVISRVPKGVYHLLEVSPPEGYQLLEGGEFRFEVEWDGEAGRLAVRNASGVPVEAEPDRPMEIPNSTGSSQNAAVIVRYAADSGEPNAYYPLPGAQFALLRLDEASGSWKELEETDPEQAPDIITNSFGYYRVQGLPDGLYRLVETKAPAGYALANRYKDPAHPGAFPGGYARELRFSPEESFVIAYIEGGPLELDMEVASMGMLLEELAPLPGAAFRLERRMADGTTWEELVYAAETGGEGRVLLEGLPAGDYRLTQISAAPGYRLPAPAEILFSIRFDRAGASLVEATYGGEPVGADGGPVRLEHSGGVRMTVESEANTCGYTVYKIDGESAAYLEGAWFRLRRRENVRAPWRDYGPAFESRLLFDGEGAPVLDGAGLHMAAAEFGPGLLYGSYQLAETQAPEGYEVDSDIRVTFDDGGTGRQVHLFTITEEMAGAGRNTAYTAADYPVRHAAGLRFRTVDAADGLAVRGAEFALYHCGEDHIHDPLPTPGSCWGVTAPVNEISDNRGRVAFGGLVSGEYLLRENQVPPGYRLPNTLWRITVDAGNAAVVVEPTNNRAYAFLPVEGEDVDWLLPNPQTARLPATGGSGRAGFVTTGLLLTAVCAAFMRSGLKK